MAHDRQRKNALAQTRQSMIGSGNIMSQTLRVKTPARSVSKPGRRLRAQELATKAIEKIIDPAAPTDERDRRRRHLTKGPLEFREDRVDLPKAKGK
jgi:hypothetical protein